MLGFGTCNVEHVEGRTFRAHSADDKVTAEFESDYNQNPVTAHSDALDKLKEEAMEALSRKGK